MTDLIAIEDAHAQERSAVTPQIECVGPSKMRLATDRNLRTSTNLVGWRQAQAGFIVLNHACNRPPFPSSGP